MLTLIQIKIPDAVLLAERGRQVVVVDDQQRVVDDHGVEPREVEQPAVVDTADVEDADAVPLIGEDFQLPEPSFLEEFFATSRRPDVESATWSDLALAESNGRDCVSSEGEDHLTAGGML